MKVLHLSTYDQGGAAKASIRLHEGLLKEGVNSKILFKVKTQPIVNSFQIPNISLKQWIENKLKRLGKILKIIPIDEHTEGEILKVQRQRHGLGLLTLPTSHFDLIQSPLYQEADIIHLHWVANFLDWKTFFAKNTKPIVWTLHDQNPFLGIEHYAERFIGVDENGAPIPRKYTEIELRESEYWLNYKKKCLQNVKNLHIVTPSQWLLNCSKSSELFAQYPHYHIPYGFPTDIFKPLDQKTCREILGLPLDKKIILFVADSVENTRKGFAFLKKALENLRNENLCLCAIGSKTQLQQHKNLIELGKIVDERLMAMAYSAADVFVIPSLEDNLPNTMIEALLCGTPVIGFPTGGIVEVLRNGENGYICKEISVQSLQLNIEKFLANFTIFNRKQIFSTTLNLYALEVQAKRYIQLYQNI
ncbi:MAG: glycosyltransferase [Microscillaceae bacterium]|nr:glycosyltransferase [Microscillaceae bacterium]MDW8459999.1 glycosyltransferase [Cytophagales bacterium]